MSTATWPSTINNLPERGSWQMKPKTSSARTDFDTGAARMRRRYTTIMLDLDFTIILTYAEMDLFRTFVETTLQGGVRWFNMTIFQGEAYKAAVVRFRNAEEPYSAADAGFDRVAVRMAIETRSQTP